MKEDKALEMLVEKMKKLEGKKQKRLLAILKKTGADKLDDKVLEAGLVNLVKDKATVSDFRKAETQNRPLSFPQALGGEE